MQQVMDISNDVAAELAGISDGVLDALRDRLHCTILLRGNRLTIEGEDESVAEARAVVDELVELVEGGHEIGPGTVDAVLSAIDQAEDILHARSVAPPRRGAGVRRASRARAG